MDANTIKNNLSENDIYSLLQDLGGEPYEQGNSIISKTICHNHDGDGSHKLYWYKDTGLFHCYTSCGSMDIFELMQKIKHIEFSEAFNYVKDYFGIQSNDSVTDYNDIIEQSFFKKFNKKVEYKPLKKLSDSFLNGYQDKYHISWVKDGIYPSTMKKFNIKMDINNQQIIIPHYDKNGELVGVRARNLNPVKVEQGKKYMPVYKNGIMLNHPTGANLYGLYENLENIKETGKIVLVESEKSVLQLDRIYHGHGIAVAISGSNFTDRQLDLIQDLGVNEVIIALDKEYDKIGDPLEKYYAKKIKETIVNKLIARFNVSVLWDTEGLLDLKDSPTDKGSKVFYKLWKNRIPIIE